MHEDDYIDMFGLTSADLAGHVLQYGGDAQMQVGFAYPVTCCAPCENSALPYADFTFDLALSFHYLFMDEGSQNIEFHLQQIMELARVAKEVRIFPLGDDAGLLSSLLGPVMLGLQQENYGIEVKDVTIRKHPEGGAMLRVWAQQCHVG